MNEPAELEHLIANVALRDRAAFLDLYDATSAKLFGVCLRILKDRPTAEDALQEAYVKIWTNAPRYAVGRLTPVAWLVTVARNHAIDVARARRPDTAEIGAAEQVPAAEPDPEQAAMQASSRAEIAICLGELEDDRARAVRGVYIEGYSYKELAAHFDVPLNTMRTWLRRSLQSLRECLER